MIHFLKKTMIHFYRRFRKQSTKRRPATAATGRANKYVKSVFIVHVGGTRCVTSCTGNIVNIHARITLTVEVIRTCIFTFLIYVEIQLRVWSRLTLFFDFTDVQVHWTSIWTTPPMSTSSATFRLTCMSFEAWRISKRRGCRGWGILPKRKRTCNSRGPKIPTVGGAVWLYLRG